MADKTLADAKVGWIAASSEATFQKNLNFGTDDFRYGLLAALFANELVDFKESTSFSAKQTSR